MAPEKKPAATLTLSELAAAVAGLLAHDYDGVRSGRVRHLPDARTIRWYQTLGMVDRPAAFRGRTALFSRRHVLQLTAIKRLQAAGHPLADIQRGLAGTNDADLARASSASLADVDRCIAEVVAARQDTGGPASLAVAPLKTAIPRPATAFWKVRPADAAPAPAAAHTPPPAALQSIPLGDQAAVVWTGLPLTPPEREAALRLARPLIEFLSARVTGGAEPAGDAVQPVPRPQQEQGGR
jgi:DNA-binding transcriptional MerR regulator